MSYKNTKGVVLRDLTGNGIGCEKGSLVDKRSSYVVHQLQWETDTRELSMTWLKLI
jgi:hypothetical protein